jgi:hypothetical protein
MNARRTKAAAILAFVIGAMAIFAGGRVLLGQDPGYYVIDWLPVYNFSAGVVTFMLTAVLIWKNSRFALPAAVATFAAHSAVMLILQTAYQDVVAPDSIQAMILRMIVWAVVLALMLFQAWKEKASAPNKIKEHGSIGK